MNDENGGLAPDQAPVEAREQPRTRNWDAVTALIAVMIGVLALLVSGYTAYIQRQQVRAEVWPNLLIGFYDPEQAIGIQNKGVGPAIVKSIEVWVDGESRSTWSNVLKALGLPEHRIVISTVSDTVISPGERIRAITIVDPDQFPGFRDGVSTRVNSEICYCSTLGECWMYSDRNPAHKPTTTAVDECPAVAGSSAFTD
jgi:hypothetical protein